MNQSFIERLGDTLLYNLQDTKDNETLTKESLQINEYSTNKVLNPRNGICSLRPDSYRTGLF